MRRRVILLLLFLFTPQTLAQAPQQGPLIAADTAQQDRILLYDLSNMTRREFSAGPYPQRVWDFSPDGCRLLVTLEQYPGLSRLFSIRLDGSDLQPLVQYDELPAGNWGIWDAQWSPDGSRIAFTLLRDKPLLDGTTTREYYIGWVSAEGGPVEFYSLTGNEHEPRWSPDGQWLAYLSYEQRAAGVDIYSTAVPTVAPAQGQAAVPLTMLSEADLWVVSADGSTKYRLTNFPTGSVRMPRWSPDGALVGFTYSPSANNDQFWMIANQPEAIATQLSAEWSLILDTTWLPDSSAMISAVRDFQQTPENLLWQIPLVGLADVDAVPYLFNPELGFADYPRFSPDGKWLVYRSAYALALVDVATQAWTLLDEGTLANTPAVWSPAAFVGEESCD